MSEKLTTIITLAGLLLLDAWYFLTTLDISGGREMMSIGPQNLPFLLSIILGILCVIKLTQTLLKESEGNIFPSLTNIALTIVFICAFYLSWEHIGLFYINCGLFLMAIITLYRRNKGWRAEVLLLNLAGAVSITLCIYLIFGLLMGVSF